MRRGLGATRGWVLFNVDIKGAYLNAKMDTQLYMREPPGYETEGGNQCLLLKRALYGAKQSGHHPEPGTHAVDGVDLSLLRRPPLLTVG